MNIDQRIISEFLDPVCGPDTMPFYGVRKSLLDAVTEAALGLNGIVLDVGCGYKPYRSIIEGNSRVTFYFGVDVYNSKLYKDAGADLCWNGNELPLADSSVDCAIATEVLEHCADPGLVLTEIARVLRPSGRIFATVPFIWNLHEVPNDEYRFTPFSLERYFTRSGYEEIHIRALGGWNGSLAQMLGLWVRFSEMSSFRRRLLSKLLFPIYRMLINRDRKPTMFDGGENSMFTGLSVSAKKKNQ